MVGYQPFFLLFLTAILMVESKNYYLMENEVENSQYVYSLFGLTKIVSKCLFFEILAFKKNVCLV